MADRLMRDLFIAISPTLSRLRERGLHLPQAGEGWGEGVLRAWLTFFVALFSVAATAEELPDPTRPPASIVMPVVAPVSGVAASQPTGLQSIIISKTRRAAIIDGETVELGGKHGDAKLVKVNEGSVVLNGAQGRQVLTLFPDVKWVSNKEVKTKPQPAATKVQVGKQKTKPVAHDEKLLSGHPEEKK